MSTPMPPARAPLRSWRRVVLALVLLVVLAWVAVPPKVRTTPLILVRDRQGHFPAQPISEKAMVEASLLRTASHLNTSTTSTIRGDHHASFRCSSVSIVTASDDLLLKRIGEDLVAALQHDPRIDRITYYPSRTRPTGGRQMISEYRITLSLRNASATNLFLYHQEQATVHITFDDQFIMNPNIYPGEIEVSWESDYDYAATAWGIQTRSLRSKAAGAAIAASAGKNLRKFLNDCHARNQKAPDE